MTRPFFLGVDGGGTKTRFTLLDRYRHVRAEYQCGSAYHFQVGVDGVEAALAEGIAGLLADADATSDEIEHAFFGLPAYGESPSIDPLVNQIPLKLLGHDRYTCGNDMICGWAGSLAGADGINIVAGTGSIGYGERRGKAARAGGWGEIFSDEGSAYWIAVAGLNAFSRMSDGRTAKGSLYDGFRAHFGLTDDLQLIALIMGEPTLARSDIAALSRLVTAASEHGDLEAREILIQAANELAQIAEAIGDALGFEGAEAVPVSYSGGMFDCGADFLMLFSEAVGRVIPVAEVRAPLFAPSIGAALYAIACADRPRH